MTSPESGSREPVKAMAAAFHRAMNHGYHGGGWDHNDGDLAHRLIDELAAEGFTLALRSPADTGEHQEGDVGS